MMMYVPIIQKVKVGNQGLKNHQLLLAYHKINQPGLKSKSKLSKDGPLDGSRKKSSLSPPSKSSMATNVGIKVTENYQMPDVVN